MFCNAGLSFHPFGSDTPPLAALFGDTNSISLACRGVSS